MSNNISAISPATCHLRCRDVTRCVGANFRAGNETSGDADCELLLGYGVREPDTADADGGWSYAMCTTTIRVDVTVP